MILRIFKFLFKATLGFLELILAALMILLVFILIKAQISPPDIPSIQIGQHVEIAPNHYVLGDNYLKKNKYGVWEMYIEGDPYERGLIYGELAKELVQRQEDIFVGQINQFIPSGAWQQFLKLFIGFFNSDLPDNIPLENQQEIYGISQSFSDEYDYIAPKYTRILNYHAAHDIGHALNDYSMVGCTSFGLKGEKSANSDLLLGRNFDFYVGDEFAEDKLLLFVNPTDGYEFVSYSWAGFTGVASGLNKEGLSVTINASKSDMPTSAKMPISLLAREILQYASTLEEAIAIAKKRETFVSETLMVSSKKDGKIVLIEKSPTKFGTYYMEEDLIVCANHFQSETFKNDEINKDNIAESDSKYRFDRVNELLDKKDSLTPYDVAQILRNQNGENGDTLGMGNPRALNQLIAHHSVVMQPEQLNFYISTQDYQLGEYAGYNLEEVFKTKKAKSFSSINSSQFVNSEAYVKFKSFKKNKKEISDFLLFDTEITWDETKEKAFIANNSESFITYEMLGRYYLKISEFETAQSYFEKALTKKVASPQIEAELSNLSKECQKKLK